MSHLISFFIILVSMTSCVIQKPGVENAQARITGFSHTGQESTCVTCHEQNRPSPDHGQKKDCSSCHTPSLGWKKPVVFSHSPVPNSCLSCHAEIRPLDSQVMRLRNPNNPDQSHFAKTDCSQCHQTPIPQKTKWNFIHTSASLSKIQFCMPCHESQGLREHSRSTGYFDQAGRCQECHTNLNKWDREDD